MKGRSLILVTLGIVVTFSVLVLVGDFDRNWDWARLHYRNLWTPTWLVRNLFFDGFRSILPWTGFILYGIWLTRLDLESATVQKRIVTVALTLVLATEFFSWVLVRFLSTHSQSMDDEEVIALFGTESMPALPLFLIAAGATATMVIVICVSMTSRCPGLFWRPLALTGQMSLTWYFAHIVIGIGTVVALGLAVDQHLVVAAAYGLLAFAITVVLSCFWKAKFRHGPLEWLMRRLAGP